MMADSDGADFVLAAYWEEGRWQVEELPLHLAEDLSGLTAILRQRPGDWGALGLVSVDEDFFVAIRVSGPETRYLLSDVTAASEWPLARQVMSELGLPLPDDEERVQPAGDVTIFADLGVDSMAVASVCDDLDLYPEEMLGELAGRMGFGELYESAVDAVLS
jgi:putative tRNA adenosine deaminase-associated protein